MPIFIVSVTLYTLMDLLSFLGAPEELPSLELIGFVDRVGLGGGL